MTEKRKVARRRMPQRYPAAKPAPPTRRLARDRRAATPATPVAVTRCSGWDGTNEYIMHQQEQQIAQLQQQLTAERAAHAVTKNVLRLVHRDVAVAHRLLGSAREVFDRHLP